MYISGRKRYHMYMKHVWLFVLAALVIVFAAYILIHKKVDAPSVTTEQPAPVVTETPEDTTLTQPNEAAVASHIAKKSNRIKLTSPAPFATITSPLTITGSARGNWFFEASFPIVVVDGGGKIVGEGVAQADGDWMTEDFVPFTATITFETADYMMGTRGTLILMRDNPSGLPENNDALEVPVLF